MFVFLPTSCDEWGEICLILGTVLRLLRPQHFVTLFPTPSQPLPYCFLYFSNCSGAVLNPNVSICIPSEPTVCAFLLLVYKKSMFSK